MLMLTVALTGNKCTKIGIWAFPSLQGVLWFCKAGMTHAVASGWRHDLNRRLTLNPFSDGNVLMSAGAMSVMPEDNCRLRRWYTPFPGHVCNTGSSGCCPESAYPDTTTLSATESSLLPEWQRCLCAWRECLSCQEDGVTRFRHGRRHGALTGDWMQRLRMTWAQAGHQFRPEYLTVMQGLQEGDFYIEKWYREYQWKYCDVWHYLKQFCHQILNQ